MNIREVAEAALKDIVSKPKGYVYASRRGIVAGSKLGFSAVLFRRVGGRVRLEYRPKAIVYGGDHEFPLPDDLEQRAAKMLDEL